jgi:hypothetical protein
VFFHGQFFVLLDGRTHPFPADILTSLLFQDLIAFQVDLNKTFFLEGSHLDESLEYFDVVEDGDFIESEIYILNFSEIEDVIGYF